MTNPTCPNFRRIFKTNFRRNRLFLLFFSFLLLSCTTTPKEETQNIRIHLDLAEHQLINGKPRLAINELQQIAESAQEIPRYQYNSGMTWLALNNLLQAEKHFKKAVQLKPDYGEALNNLGLLYQLNGKKSEAETAFLQALAIPDYKTPELPACNLAQLYMRQNKTQQALQAARKALAFKPDSAFVLFINGKVCAESGNFPTALSFLQQAAQLAPKNTEITQLLKQVQTKLKKLNAD